MISLISEKLVSSLRCEIGRISQSLHSLSIELPPKKISKSGRQSKLEAEILPSWKKRELLQCFGWPVIKVHFLSAKVYFKIESKNLSPFVPPYMIKNLSSIRAD